MRRRTLAALAAAAALTVAGCGAEDGASGSADGNASDRAFAAEMIPHHRSAVEMAEIARKRGESAFVRQLAADIAETQENEIAVLQREDRELARAGVERGTLDVDEHMAGMGEDASALARADDFDRAFVEMMIPHHEGAITMARAEIADGQDPELRALAEEIIAAQESEIAEMREHVGEDADGGHDDGSH